MSAGPEAWKHLVATRRVMRAILKAVCLHEIGMVKAYNPEDTVRFWALRLQEGFVKATPQKLIARGTDWRFLNELKKELKG